MPAPLEFTVSAGISDEGVSNSSWTAINLVASLPMVHSARSLMGAKISYVSSRAAASLISSVMARGAATPSLVRGGNKLTVMLKRLDISEPMHFVRHAE